MQRLYDGIQTLAGQGMRSGIHLFQGSGIVVTIAPESVRIDIDWVSHAKIVKWTEQLFFKRFWQADLSGKAMTEIGSDILAVHTFGSRGQAEKNLVGESSQIEIGNFRRCHGVLHR